MNSFVNRAVGDQRKLIARFFGVRIVSKVPGKPGKTGNPPLTLSLTVSCSPWAYRTYKCLLFVILKSTCLTKSHCLSFSGAFHVTRPVLSPSPPPVKSLGVGYERRRP